jgi:hypothetical protein
MKQTTRVKPNKQSAIGGFIIGIFFLIFAVVFLIAVLGDTEEDAVVPIVAFFIVFIVGILYIIIYSGWILFSKKGVSVLELETDGEEDAKDGQKTLKDDVPTRLKKLEELKTTGLITEEEYRKKREEIIKTI